MGPLRSSAVPEFPHRNNRDGTYDSICPACLVTVASCKSEAGLLAYERKHVCDKATLTYLSSIIKGGAGHEPK